MPDREKNQFEYYLEPPEGWDEIIERLERLKRSRQPQKEADVPPRLLQVPLLRRRRALSTRARRAPMAGAPNVVTK